MNVCHLSSNQLLQARYCNRRLYDVMSHQL